MKTMTPKNTVDTTTQERAVSDRPATVSEAVRHWWVVPLVLLLLASTIAALRLRTFSEPFERDIITYMLLGHTINQGGQIFKDAWEMKPPGIFLIYAWAERAVGFGESQVYLLSVVAAVATLVGVYVAGATRGRNAGLWAAAFWAVLWGVPSVQANQPNTEVFINACVVGALALLLGAGGSSRGVTRAFAIGMLFAFGTFIKQIVIIDTVLLSGVHVAVASGLPGGRRRALRDVAIIGAVGAVFWFLIVGYFAATGRFEIFWVTNSSNAQAYAGNPLFNLFRYVREAKFFPQFLWFSAPIGVLVLLGAIRDRRAIGGRHWALYLTALVSLQIKIALNGQGFLPHYYQYWLPMLAIGAGWAAGAKSPLPERFPAWAMAAAGALVYASLLLQQGSYYPFPADEWSHFKYGTSVIEGREMGRAIGAVLEPGETLYQHGNQPEFYYYSGHFPHSFLLWTAYLNDTFPAAKMLLKRHLAALDAARPDLIVVELPDESRPVSNRKNGLVWRLLVGRESVDKGQIAQSVLDILLPSYRPAQIKALDRFTGYRYYIRRGSALERRLAMDERPGRGALWP